MSSYDLTSGLADSFEFNATIAGKNNHYVVKYPSQKELEPITRGYARLGIIDKEISKCADDSQEKKDLENEVEEIGKKMVDAFSALFTPDEGSMPISELLENLPLNAKKNFDNMIAEQFGTKE